MSFSHWLINRGVWRNPFNNREMMIGIPNRPLYFYQKDIIVIWYIQNLHFHHPDYPQFYHDSAGWYNGMAWYGSPSLGCVKATLVVKSTVFVNPLFAFRLETCFFFKQNWLVVSNMNGLFSMIHLGCHPSHWRSLHDFSRWAQRLLHHQPVMVQSPWIDSIRWLLKNDA